MHYALIVPVISKNNGWSGRTIFLIKINGSLGRTVVEGVKTVRPGQPKYGGDIANDLMIVSRVCIWHTLKKHVFLNFS